jgi:hypothetical protein
VTDKKNFLIKVADVVMHILDKDGKPLEKIESTTSLNQDIARDYSLDEDDRIKYHNERFLEIPLELFPRIKEIFDENLPPKFVEESKELISLDGLNDWYIPYHFTVGMKIRNLLRSNDIYDDMFPTGNLDDYYGVMLEWWLGYRTVSLK